MLQFRKLCRYEDENVEEWMGRLWVEAVEYNYQKVNRQLKEQFIHGLNDKSMLEEIIKELTTSKNDDCITSGGVLVWAKRVETQRAQVAVLNTITESRQFDKIKVSRKVKESKTKIPMHQSSTPQQPCRYCGGTHQPRQCPAYGKMCMECNKFGHFSRVCWSRKSRVVNEMEQEVTPEYTEDNLETVSMNSVSFNKSCSMLTAKLKTSIDNKNMVIPYKIDTVSDINIMPWYIVKKLLPRVTNYQLVKTIKTI